jgi:hypothetical protein
MVIVGILTLLAYWTAPLAVGVPVVAFLIVYVLSLLLAFEAEQIYIPVICLFLAPFAIYPFRNIYVAIAVLLALYVLCYWGLRQYLKGFPWNSKYWKADPVRELRKQAIRQGGIGWPFKFLNIYEAPAISFGGAFLLSLLLTWWICVLRWLAEIPYSFGLLVLFAVYVAWLRWWVYGLAHRPPISLWGRIFTFRWIIPRYDMIYVAPICVLLAGTLVPFALGRAGLDRTWNFELSFFLIFLLAFSLPPRLREWSLTGPHRIAKRVQSVRARPPDTRGQRLEEFFAAKFKTDLVHQP